MSRLLYQCLLSVAGSVFIFLGMTKGGDLKSLSEPQNWVLAGDLLVAMAIGVCWCPRDAD